jgi:radical SAM enzyme (TIGR01210 family)
MNEERPLASWTGTDRLDDRIVPTLTVILKTPGCAWRRCRMCSYRHERHGTREDAESLIRAQLAYVRREYDGRDFEQVKLFSSGSLLDPDEVPPAALDAIADAFRGRTLVVETRPEYVDRARLAELAARLDTGTSARSVFVAIGLETTSDLVREKSIDKGFSYAMYLHAVREARQAGAGVKVYLLHKPLFLTESEAIEDMNRSIAEVSPHADLISMNPCTVQRRTELEWYWQRRAYRPPYLWSVLSILLDAGRHVTADPLGGGRSRGPHNCGACDREIVDAIREYSLTADRTRLVEAMAIPCDCKKEWEFVLGNERPYCMPLTR